MAGRGDNNKHGSSGRGSSNQGATGTKTKKSNHGQQTGGTASKKQQKARDTKVRRNTDVDQE